MIRVNIPSPKTVCSARIYVYQNIRMLCTSPNILFHICSFKYCSQYTPFHILFSTYTTSHIVLHIHFCTYCLPHTLSYKLSSTYILAYIFPHTLLCIVVQLNCNPQNFSNIQLSLSCECKVTVLLVFGHNQTFPSTIGPLSPI